MNKLTKINPKNCRLLVDLKYATSDNFLGRPLYLKADAYLHPDAATALNNACDLAGELGLMLKIFDAFRPHEVQKEMWHINPDPNFLSNPETGSCPHCRGVAVDLTLVDISSGLELDMGTDFDAFVRESHHGTTSISKEAQKNRLLLLGIMTAAGWDFYRNEWWHYQLFNCRSYPLLTDATAQTGLCSA